MITHQMEEVERLCDRVLLLAISPRAEAYGTVESVREAYGGHIAWLQYSGTP